MRLTVQFKVVATPDQHAALLATMRAFNAAANYVARAGFQRKVFGRAALCRLCYHETRKRFGVPSEMAVRAINAVVDVYRRDRSRVPVFRERASVIYGGRALRYIGHEAASILTLGGRIQIGLQHGPINHQLRGETDLILRDGQFYLYACTDTPEPPIAETSDYLGVDMGVVNLATTSDGRQFTGEAVELVRQRHFLRKRSLQRMTKQTKKRRTRRNARRASQYGRNREARFRRDVNHCISKTIIREAQGTKRGVAIEDLNGIRARTRFKKGQRARIGGWGFSQLRTFIEYKGKLAGVKVVTVSPKYTSRTCSQCQHCEDGNRRSQAEFRCQACGFAAHADINAAQNIRAKALVGAPQVTESRHVVAA